MNARVPRRGFSLVELLAVVAVIVVLIGVAVPSISSLLGGRGMTRAVSEIVSLIETARNQAMTMQSLVWLCFEQGTNEQGEDELRAVLLVPIDGTATTVTQSGRVTIASTTSESTVFHWPRLKLVPLSALPDVLNLAPPETSSEALASQRAQPFLSGKTATAVINYQTITFTPQGYAMLTAIPKITTPYVRMIDLGLQQTRPGGSGSHPDSAGLLVNGFNGQVQILRR